MNGRLLYGNVSRHRRISVIESAAERTELPRLLLPGRSPGARRSSSAGTPTRPRWPVVHRPGRHAALRWAGWFRAPIHSRPAHVLVTRRITKIR